jgi:purine nucleoside permease
MAYQLHDAFVKISSLTPLFITLCSIAVTAAPGGGAEIFRPKVIVLTTFEVGADTGDAPGELQYWVEREHLTHSLVVPGIAHPLLYNDDGVLAMVTGTCNRSGLAVMMLGLDARFDLTHSYFLIAGIAGADPDKASVGSAAWANWVVDADNVNEVDSRELPASWSYGIFPYGAHTPDGPAGGPGDWAQKPMTFELNSKLVHWAFELTKNVGLTETPEAKRLRESYYGQPNAQRPPFVLIGDSLGTARYWHGVVLNRWANDWVKKYTQGRGNFVISDCEDQSISYALYMLGIAGRVDPQRELVLRTASNNTTPPRAGLSVVDSLLNDEDLGTVIAAESAYRVGSPVVHELLANWTVYRDRIPGQ